MCDREGRDRGIILNEQIARGKLKRAKEVEFDQLQQRYHDEAEKCRMYDKCTCKVSTNASGEITRRLEYLESYLDEGKDCAPYRVDTYFEYLHEYVSYIVKLVKDKEN